MTRPQLQDEDAAAGFTLMEMLVALVLASLIAVVLVQAIRTARTALASVDRQSGDGLVEAVQRHLRATIAQARTVRLTAQRVGAPLIEAGPDRLELVSDHVPAGQFGGLYAITLALEPASTGGLYDLVETRTLHRPATLTGSAGTPRPQTRTRLLRDVEGLSLRYFGTAVGEADAGWSPQWRHPAQLPALVAVEVLLGAADRRRWPPLVVEPAAGR